jgi:hypothetical protein
VEWASSVALSNESSTTLVEAAAPPLDSVQAAELFGSRDKVARDLALPPFPFAIMSSSFFLSLLHSPIRPKHCRNRPSGVPGSKCGTGGFSYFLVGSRGRPKGRDVFFFPYSFLNKSRKNNSGSSLD